MKSDLEQILGEKNLDGLLVTGPGMHNPAMVYLTGGGHLTNADLIVKRGDSATLFHASMERDEAAKSGFNLKSYAEYPYADLLKTANQDRTKAIALRYRQMLLDCGLSNGRVGLLGKIDAGYAWSVFNQLRELLPDLELIGDSEMNIIKMVMSTKDEREVERIRQMGKITTAVVGKTADYLSGQRLRDGILQDSTGEPVTIGAVKKKINLWIAEAGAENPEGTIFAQGRDAAVPHSSGTSEDILRAGQTIVFDIFPCEAGGGYYYDMTRTWCIGHAPDEALKLYEQVKAVFEKVIHDLRAGVLFSQYQQQACTLFEEMGHPTIASDPAIESGYVHSLGHGVGLFIHEKPMSGANATADDVLQPGSVFTIEPGLYYPERGMGVRIENTYRVRPDGQIEVLAEYPIDLVLPVRG